MSKSGINHREINFIEKPMSLFTQEESYPIDNTNYSEFRFIGDIFGMVYKGKPISREMTLKKLTEVKKLDELIEIIRFIVGASWFILKKKDTMMFISTGSAPSFYFYKVNNNLIFSKSEQKICKYAIKNEDLNPFEIYDIFKTKRFDSVPYGALFNNIRRIPDGHVLEIDNKLNLNYFSYYDIKPHINIKYNYKYFKQLIESVAKLYVDTKKNLFLYWAAGIDSFVIYLALSKFSDNVIPVGTSQDFEGSFDGAAVREYLYIAKKIFDINSKLLYANRYSEEQRKIRVELCKMTSSNNARWDSFVWYSGMAFFRDVKNTIFLSGSEMDDGYGIAFTKFRGGKGKRVIGMKGRYFYSKAYQRHLNFLLNRKFRELEGLSLNIHKDPKIEYITSMIYMREFQNSYYPVIRNLSNYPKEFLKKYQNYKLNNFLKSVFRDSNELLNLPNHKINKKFRILRHFFSIPNVLRDSYARDIYRNQINYHLPTEGPMVDFFCNLQLGWRDVYAPKRYLHKYFRDNTGKKYLDYFNTRNLKKCRSIFVNDIKGKNISIRRAELDRFLASEVFQKDFHNYVDLHNPTILKYITNSYVRNFIKQCYKDAIKGLTEYNDYQNIFNIEIFIKNLEKISNK